MLLFTRLLATCIICGDHVFVCLLVGLLVCLLAFVCSLRGIVCLLMRLLVRSFALSVVCLLGCPVIRSLVCLFVCVFVR